MTTLNYFEFIYIFRLVITTPLIKNSPLLATANFITANLIIYIFSTPSLTYIYIDLLFPGINILKNKGKIIEVDTFSKKSTGKTITNIIFEGLYKAYDRDF